MKVLFPLPISPPVPAQLEQDPNNETSTRVVPAADVALLLTAPPDVDVDQRAVQNNDQTVDVTTAPDENARAETHGLRRSCRERSPPTVFGNGQCNVRHSNAGPD